MASRTLPPPPRPKVLPISKLRKCPVCVNLHTEQLIEAIRTSVEEGRAPQGITVGVSGDDYYIVDGHARVEAFQRAGFVEVNVGEVLDLGSTANILIEHVRRNIHSPLNPIKVFLAASLLAKEGVEEPLKALRLTPVMQAAVRVLTMWPVDIMAMVSDLLDKSTARFSDVNAVPHFFVTFEDLSMKASSREKGAEEELRDTISHIVQYLESIGDEREFTLPGPDQILALVRDRRRQINAVVQASKAPANADPTYSEDTGVGGAGRDDPDGDEVGDDRVWYREPVVMPDRNKSMIECIHCGREQVVDLKTGHVCPVESVAGGMIDVIRDGDGYRSYALSMKAMKFLGLDRPAEEISPAKYVTVATDAKSEVERAVRSTRPAARFVLIISDSDTGPGYCDPGEGSSGTHGNENGEVQDNDRAEKRGQPGEACH
jgi:hypothetical protein